MEQKQKWIGHSWLLYAAWIVSIIATLGSLYLSEVMLFIPCELCWYQRIFMYPLVLILGIAAIYGEMQIRKYALTLAVIGVSISIHHYLIQKLPGYSGFRPCMQGIPCNKDYLDWFGFITIPFLAMVAFIMIITLVGWSLLRDRKDRKAVSE